jgi:hypothetical protein
MFHGMPPVGLLAPAASLLAALSAGLGKGAADWLANRRAGWQVHEVSATDVAATVLGAVPVAAPLFLMLWSAA